MSVNCLEILTERKSQLTMALATVTATLVELDLPMDVPDRERLVYLNVENNIRIAEVEGLITKVKMDYGRKRQTIVFE